jgi:chloramphenicol 3-O phosphotransferase
MLPSGLYCGAVATQVIVLNGGSSSGKSGIARCLQAVLPDPWLAFGIDVLVQALPTSTRTSATGIGVVYDLQVDTTHTEALECARAIATRVH